MYTMPQIYSEESEDDSEDDSEELGLDDGARFSPNRHG